MVPNILPAQTLMGPQQVPFIKMTTEYDYTLLVPATPVESNPSITSPYLPNEPDLTFTFVLTPGMVKECTGHPGHNFVATRRRLLAVAGHDALLDRRESKRVEALKTMWASANFTAFAVKYNEMRGSITKGVPMCLTANEPVLTVDAAKATPDDIYLWTHKAAAILSIVEAVLASRAKGKGKVCIHSSRRTNLTRLHTSGRGGGSCSPRRT